jgi:DNA-binding MarR family transcriptional regulator
MGTVQPHPASSAEMARLVSEASETLALLWGRSADDTPHRLSLPQLRALLVIRRGGGVTVTALAEAIDASPSSASRLGDRLVAAGLVRRSENAHDRRGFLLHVSADGAAVLDRLGEARTRHIADLLDRMAPASRHALLTGLLEFARVAADRPRDGRAAGAGT